MKFVARFGKSHNKLAICFTEETRMAVTDKKVVGILNTLYELCKAGEKGFEVVAENARNRGLKMLMKTYAQQRAEFANELEAEIQRLGGEVSKRENLRGLVHRGRIDFVATLTIGEHNVENGILSEALVGETAAVNAYRKALLQELPAETEAIVKQQRDQILQTYDQVELLRGRTGERLVVRLFDSHEDTQAAVEALVAAGFSKGDMESVLLEDFSNLYSGKGTTIKETIISGALGGAIWGSLIGAVAGISVWIIPGFEPIIGTTLQSTWAAIALGGTIIGAFFAVLLGFLIALGISEDDEFLYDDSLKHGVELLKLKTTNERWEEATEILQQINAASRARPALETSAAS
jgi:uncharacterized protein (TIGR02284 family)